MASGPVIPGLGEQKVRTVASHIVGREGQMVSMLLMKRPQPLEGRELDVCSVLRFDIPSTHALVLYVAGSVDCGEGSVWPWPELYCSVSIVRHQATSHRKLLGRIC